MRLCYGLAFSRLSFLRSWIIACMVFMVLDAAFGAYISLQVYLRKFGQ